MDKFAQILPKRSTSPVPSNGHNTSHNGAVTSNGVSAQQTPYIHPPSMSKQEIQDTLGKNIFSFFECIKKNLRL